MGRLMVYVVKSGGGFYFVNINVYGYRYCISTGVDHDTIAVLRIYLLDFYQSVTLIGYF